MKLPHAPESERAIVAAMMLKPNEVDAIAGIVTNDHMHDARYRATSLAECRLFDPGEPVDVVSTARQLEA